MIDPRIGLSPVMVPSVSKALNIYDNALLSAEARKQRELEAPMRQRLLEAQTQQAEQGATTGQQQIEQEKQNSIIRSIAEFSPIIKPLLENAVKTGDTAEAQTALTQRLIQLQKQGRDTTETVEAITQLRNGNPQQVLAEVNAIDAAAQQRGLNLGPQKSVGQQEFSSLITQAQGDPESLETKAARIKLGLDPRATGSAQITTATTPGLTETVAESDRILKQAGEEGKLEAQRKLKPQIESAVKTAVSGAVQAANQAQEQRSNSKALEVYEIGINGLTDRLSKTTTGPILGRFFALSDEQQAADGAVAAMAPILKQMFRSAGEGNFTDSDQKLLMDMIPTRSDGPEAIKSKLQNIDAIVRAKLGTPSAKQEEPSADGFKIINVE